MSVVLVHGIWTDGHGSIFRLQPALKRVGLDVRCFTYPHSQLIHTLSRKRSDENAELLCDFMRPGDDVIFHSNGGRVVHRAMEKGAIFRQAYGFAPAFSARAQWPQTGFWKMNIIHNDADRALLCGALIPGHAFGLLGMIGYQGPHDPRIHSISNRVCRSVDRHNHSQMWLDDRRRARWESYLIKRLMS